MRTLCLQTLAATTLLALCGPTFAQNTTWVNDWFDSYTSTSSGSFEGQQRGYYTMGSFQGRWRMSNDYLVSVSPPRIKTGCGGIDVFGGGYSYLDPEFLVEKFERMIQAAPAFAFDLALQELCKPCVTAMQAFEDITDQLNSIQVNDCALTKKTVAYLAQPTAEHKEALREETAGFRSIGANMKKNWQSFQEAVRANRNQAPDDIKPDVDGCSSVYRDIFANGSVVANMAARFGLDEYSDLIRGMIGDVVVTPAATAFSVRELNACPGNDQADGVDFTEGTVELMNVNGECRPSGEDQVVLVIETRLRSIADRMRGATALTADDQLFIENAPLPIFNMLRDAVIAGNVDQVILSVREPLAVAYGHKILDDFFRTSNAVLLKAHEIANQVTVDAASTGRCNTGVLSEATDALPPLARRAQEYRSKLHQNYTKKTAEMLAQLQASREYENIRIRSLNRAASTIKQ